MTDTRMHTQAAAPARGRSPLTGVARMLAAITRVGRALVGRVNGVVTQRHQRRVDANQMTVLEHLEVARRRLIWALAGVGVATIAGWFLFDPLIAYLTRPLGATQTINFTTVGAAFDLHLQVSLWAGLLISSPWWIGQCWLYLAPGLSLRERLHVALFALAGAVLFIGGAVMGLWVAPAAIEILNAFVPPGASTLLTADLYLQFYLRLVLVFGFSALVPEVLVALNFLGLVSARWMLRQWRWATLAAFIFAAIANPLPQPWSMIIQALILVVVYFLAVAIAAIHDSQRKRSAI